MYPNNFWFFFAIIIGIWGFALADQSQGLSNVPPAGWFSSALFFALYFMLPLFRKRPILQATLISCLSLLVMVLFWPLHREEPNHFILLLFGYLAGEAAYRLHAKQAIITGIVIAISIILPGISESGEYFSAPFLIFYLALLCLALQIFHRLFHDASETEARYDALLHEYRGVKRMSISNEKMARQQERTQVGREIHDSVGHKLTNLLMQLEVARLKSDGAALQRINLLKELAQESLEETRRAVKALNQDEIGGIAAIISLIRKLEAENFIRIHFEVKNRAFSAQLSPDQTVAVYRAVQESLTNVMRHGYARETFVLFESPGERIFRFEVSNPIPLKYSYKEGYGLSAMRERVQQSGGRLDVLAYNKIFIVRGTFPLQGKDDATNGSDSVG
ncbi:sensor histidine kinase [Sediminibacillus massiliensis]|uniref:sensor histidine kinase n=1 Tax=Sediminibacillus massiliensis TaxID=1926277 RepID=UPI0009887E23|nr:sensor histidine kinase [Sediminibacillus massiliensis]